MHSTCDYHPTQKAWWYCPQCEKCLCPNCVVQRSGRYPGADSLYFCPKCNTRTEFLGVDQIVTPFWKRLHQFFLYPLKSIPALVLIFGLALLSLIFSQPGLISAAIRFVLWAVMVKYSYEALRTTAEGELAPPPLNAKVLSEDFGIVFKQIGMFIALALIFGLFIARMGPWAMLFFGIGVAVALPAMIIILAINDDLIAALNPVVFVGIMTRIGWKYLLLFFFLLLLSIAPGAFGYYFVRFMPDSLHIVLMVAAKNYYTLISYHLMGYVILQYHQRLGYQVAADTFIASSHPAAGPPVPGGNADPPEITADAGLSQEIALLAQAGELDKAIGRLKERAMSDSGIEDIALSQRYISLLSMQKRTDDIQAYAHKHLDLLVGAEKKSHALKFYLNIDLKKLKAVPAAKTLFRLAGWLNESGRFKHAVNVLSRLTRWHPNDPLIPKTYLLVAQIFNERLMAPEKAKEILDRLIQKFPDHDITAFARNYLATI